MPKRKEILTFIIGLLVLANCLAWSVVYDLSRPQLLEVHFFDVGQGESIFIETPSRQQILIDGGPDSTILEKLGKELPFWDKSLDLIILTHPEQDHMTGLIEVLERYKVDYILWTGIVRDTAAYKKWREAISTEVDDDKAVIKIAQAGQKIILSGSHPNSLEILHPFESMEGIRMKNSNDSSIVARLKFGTNTFLFTGDITKKVEWQLVGDVSPDNLRVTVLKVAHHGSKTSTAPEFIEAVSPEIAIISCGKDNPYGHPHPRVLATLEKFGIRILRTDTDGDIKLCFIQKKKKQ